MQLVPCRWQRNGWKYVEADPSHHQFFTNPNRINSVGFGLGNPPHLKNQGQPRVFEESDRFGGTTYQTFFKQ